MAVSRRSWLRTAAMAGATFRWWPKLLAEPSEDAPAKACVLVFLEGGPSQIDTFDPKPGTPHGGPIEAIDTSVEGLKFSQYVPKLAEIADKLAVIRTLHSTEGDHERANSLLHTGYAPTPRMQYPALGATVARQFDDPEADVPAYVSFGSSPSSGILGPKFGPMVVTDVNNPAPALMLPEGFSEARIERRLAVLERFNAEFGRQYQTPLSQDLTALTLRADRMRRNPLFRPYDAAAEEPEAYERYGGGANDFLSRAGIAARRLIEHGVRFVEIQYGGWDTHADNFNQVQALCGPLDAMLSSLIADLNERGLLQQTLVACFGEFGRTPQINGAMGRDHFPDVFSAILAGGGLTPGRAVGASSDDGLTIADRPVSVPDFHATIFAAMGLDVKKDYFAPDGRLLRLTNNGTPLRELLPQAQ